MEVEDYKKLEWEDKIKSFTDLDENWDGEGAKKIPESIISSSIKFIQKLNSDRSNLKMVYPSYMGSVGLIYEINSYKIYILFLSEYEVQITIFESDNNLKSDVKYEIDSIKSFQLLIN